METFEMLVYYIQGRILEEGVTRGRWGRDTAPSISEEYLDYKLRLRPNARLG